MERKWEPLKSYTRSFGLLIFFLIAGSQFAGCSIDEALKGGFEFDHPDFLKTEILVQGPAPADGVTPAVIVIRLMHSSLQVEKGYRPEYKIQNASGIIKSDCTLSDINGMSICLLRSQVPGLKDFVITKPDIHMHKGVEFTYFSGPRPTGGLISSSVQSGVGNGYKIQSAIGSVTPNVKVKTSDFTILSDVQGNLLGADK